MGKIGFDLNPPPPPVAAYKTQKNCPVISLVNFVLPCLVGKANLKSEMLELWSENNLA